MSNTTFRALRISDPELVKALIAIANEPPLRPESCTVQIHVAQNIVAPETQIKDLGSLPVVQHAIANDTNVWSVAVLKTKLPSGRATLTVNREDADVRVTVEQQDNSDALQAAQFIENARKLLRGYNPAEALSRALGPELSEFYQRREQALMRLEDLSQKLVTDTNEYRSKLDEDARVLRERLQRDSDERIAKLDDLYRQKESGLAAREQVLADEKVKLDDRSARHARRQLRQDLKARIAESSQRFVLSSETGKKRYPIHVIFVGLLLSAGTVLYRGLFYPPDSTNQWIQGLQLLRVPTGIVGFALAAVYYIKWNDRWFRQHADEEFRLKQLELDVDRASWVMEMLLEWQEDKETALPAALVDRLTANLFADTRGSDVVRHPTEDLASALLEASSGLRVNVPGIGEATLSGKGLKKFQKSIEE